MLSSAPYKQTYEPFPPPEPYIHSLSHTFPRFKYVDVSLWFQLVPSHDSHLDCIPANFEYSRTGIPYPKLAVFAQSLLDTAALDDLTDLVDGMDLTEVWGEENLDLSGTNDVKWAEQKNEAIRMSVPRTEESCMLELPCAPFSRREAWHGIVTTKAQRMGPEMGANQTTRFRFPDSPDPRYTNDRSV